MPNEHEFTRGINPLCPDDSLWTARDEQSSEDEVNEFLHALVRLIKPRHIVETGCYLGDATIAMARALKRNNAGVIITCDIVPERVEAVQRRILEEGLEKWAYVILSDGKSLIARSGSQTDFAFIDSGPEGAVRGAEIEELLKHLRPLKMFALHDTAPQARQISAVADAIRLPKVYFNTPRGLSLFMRPM